MYLSCIHTSVGYIFLLDMYSDTVHISVGHLFSVEYAFLTEYVFLLNFIQQMLSVIKTSDRCLTSKDEDLDIKRQHFSQLS